MKRNIIIVLVSVLILTGLFVLARTTTTDLGLVKPTWEEEEDILDDFNANVDILEAFANDPLEFDAGERLEDRVGAMFSGNTETGLTLTYQDADNTIDVVIGADDIVESMIKFVNLGNDEEIVTRETSTGDFEYHTLAELSIQPLDAGLTSIAGLTTAANKSIYTTALDTYAVYDLSAFARTILDDAAATNVRDTLGLAIGTNVEAHDDGLLSIAGLTTAANKSIYTTALDVYAVYDLTAFGRSILDDANAGAVRTTIGAEVDLSNEAGLYAVLSDVSDFVQGAEVNSIDSGMYVDASIDHEHLAPDVISGMVDVTSADADYILIWDVTDSALKKCDMGEVRGTGGFTTFSQFDEETAWRVYYSDAAGDITELALGADGTYLASGGAAVAPAWETPAGSGTVTTSGTPVANDYARFTAATVIEGRSYAEAKSDLGFISDVVDDTSPELGGELDAGAHSIGFTQQAVTGSDATTTIDWTIGNKFKFTFGAMNETFTFTAPSNPCNILLMLIQDGVGSRLATWPGTVKWVGGTAPTLTTTAAGIDICSFYWDGTNYFGVASLAFAVP